MKILINCSNLKIGGGLQVADSFCRTLNSFPEHIFCVVLSSPLHATLEAVSTFPNVHGYEYSVSNKNVPDILSGRDRFLDNCVKENKIQAVISVFGPIYWRPSCSHMVGFARAQMLSVSSPYRELLSPFEKFSEKVKNRFMKHLFLRSGDMFYSENAEVTRQVKELFHTDKVITSTNTFNQVFLHPESGNEFILPPFGGITLLTVSSSHLHKNLSIIPRVTEVLIRKYKDFNFRFVITVGINEIRGIAPETAGHIVCIGKVDVSQCPSLYRQCDIEFQPTLLECFTATYPEAMVSGCPIITTNLGFSRELCGDAAEYYDPLDAEAAADAIYRVATDEDLRNRLVEEGRRQLDIYDNYLSRAKKIIDYVVNNS